MAIAALSAVAALVAQTAPGPDWRKIGNSAVELMLASPAGGPVDAVWFASDGARLYARTRSGAIFETADFEHWTVSDPLPQAPQPDASVAVERSPAGAARLVSARSSPGRVYALGADLFRSDDGGRTWTNLTAYRSESVIGSEQRSLAVAPNDPDQLVVANDYGVWRSLDGGLSWTGLNQFLPNLMARRILSTPPGLAGTRLLVDGYGVVEWQPGNAQAWQPAEPFALEAEARTRRDYAAALRADITAFAAAGDTVYAGAADGRIWISFDRGRTWRDTQFTPRGPVEGLFVDAAEPRVALAALGGPGPRVLRTTNSGNFWDDLSADLPESPVHAVTADRNSGAVYAATDRGVFFAVADLENANPAAPTWTPITAALPRARAADVKLDAAGNQIYILLEGYGVYAARAPHRHSLRLVNAADFSNRPAAPGSLLSVLGGRVNSARAGILNFPVLAASEAESQIQVPFEATGPSVSLMLQANGGAYRLGVPVLPVSPAVFVSRDGSPMLLDADSGLMLDARKPARSNSRIQILVTGLGRVRPDWPTGLAAPLENPPAVAATVRAFVDRAPVEVTRAVLAPGYVGFYLVELQLPAIVNAGPAELHVSAEGQESNRVRIFLEP